MAGIINSLLKPEDDPLKAATNMTDAKNGAANPTMTATSAAGGYEPEKITLDDSESVAGRIASITQRDSPLNTVATAGAMKASNKRGLINSTRAVEAGQKAVIDTAKDIATADAQLSMSAKQSNQNAQNQMLSQKLTGEQNIQQIDKQGKVNSQLNLENFTYEKNLQQLRGNQAKELSELETRANQISQASNSVGIISSQVNASIGEILANPEMTPETKQQLIDLQIKQYRNQLAVLGGMNELDLAGLLDFSELGGTGAPVQQGSGTGGPVTGGPNPEAATFKDYVSSLLKQAGGAPSESLIIASLDEAVRRGESASAVFTALRPLYPTVTDTQFQQELTNRGYANQGGKLVYTGERPPEGTNPAPSPTQPAETDFATFASSTLAAGATEQNILSVLAKAREQGLDAEAIYNTMSPYFPGIGFNQFLNELANRGYYDLMGASL